MALLCKVFGHQPPIYAPKGWFSPGEEYGRLHAMQVDGIGRVHAEVWFECPRCRQHYKAGRIHIPEQPTNGADKAGVKQ